MSETNESDLVEETARRTIAGGLTTELLDAAERGIWPQALWETLEAQGLTQPATGAAEPAEALPIEASLLRAAASTALPLPLAETAVAASILMAHGLTVPSGVLTLAPFDRDDELTFENRRIAGRLERVPWGRDASAIVAIADSCLILLDAKLAAVTHGANFAGEPRDTLVYRRVEVMASGGAVERERLLARIAAARAMQLAAAAARALEITVEYATQRNQFGRPIGNFQAIQHQLAAAAGEAASACVAADQAYAALASGRRELYACAIAKARASDAAGIVARTAHQVHGAIGYTREYQLQRFTRRIQAWRGEYGPSAYWSQRLGELALAAPQSSLWEFISAT